jgi:hypothetical protein
VPKVITIILPLIPKLSQLNHALPD